MRQTTEAADATEESVPVYKKIETKEQKKAAEMANSLEILLSHETTEGIDNDTSISDFDASSTTLCLNSFSSLKNIGTSSVVNSKPVEDENDNYKTDSAFASIKTKSKQEETADSMIKALHFFIRNWFMISVLKSV